MERIESIDDARVAAYRDLPERTLRGENIFVAEGRLLTLRLLESGYRAESVFVSEQFADEFRRLVGDATPLYVASEALLAEVVGFKFHRGVLAAGRRDKSPTLDELMGRKGLESPVNLLICPEMAQPENLGLIFRSAAGFGVDGVLLGRACCDPFSRRCLRTSMGAVLRVPYLKSSDLLADLCRLRERWRVELLAAVLDEQAEPLSGLRWPRRAGILFGNEYEGLAGNWLSASDRRVTIPMQPGTDSLNVGVAAGIFIYEMRKAAASLR
jgi:tRNA G18 (ribose-2'-O)-methylase SpoU